MGIDLGTSNTCVAVMEGDRPVVIPNAEGERVTPSVIAFAKDGSVLVGNAARRQAVMNPERTYYSVKRLIGRRFSDLGDEGKDLAYEIREGEKGAVAIAGSTRDLTPIELSAQILKSVKSFAEDYWGEECVDAVITVPAYFDDTQRGATRDAARVAGINVLRVINEPTAAALAYGWAKGREGTLLVFDWGGGTFDCSVLDCSDGVIQVRATRGDSTLGGDDIDRKLIGLLKEHYYRSHGVEVGDAAVPLARLREAAEQAKKELSSAVEADVMLPFFTADASGPKHLEMSIQRARFETLLKPLVERAMTCVEQALEDAGVSASDIDDVLLVGGSTKIPYVQRALEDFFGQPPRKGVSADEAVAIGAALQAGIVEGTTDDVLLLDVLPLSLGIAEGDRFASILRRNTTVPTYRTENFSTVRDFQSSVLLKVYQGDHSHVKDNRLVGTFRFEPLPPMRAGQVKVEVKLSVDENGLLEIEARDARTGRKQAMSIRDSMRLTDAEVARLRVNVEQDEEI
ncbi:MAG: molecular chaperone DnaK [Myxococcota bacterium]|jgi:molecular chaperone DnaK